MKRIIIQLLQSILSFIIAFMFVNILCFFYERPVAWIDRESGVTSGVRTPNGILVHGTEGYGITCLDDKGHSNSKQPLIENGYVLVMGSSHTQGKEVAKDERYTEILNRYVSGNDEDNLHVYNVALDGNYLPSLLRRFTAGVEEYPNARTIVIEITDTDYSVEQLKLVKQQIHYNQDEAAEVLFENASFFMRVKIIIKEFFPLIHLYQTKMETMGNNKLVGSKKIEEIDNLEYEKILKEDLELVRSIYSGNIIFVYHPDVKIEPNGDLVCLRSQTVDIFEQVCESNEILFIDTGDEFIEYYEKYSKVPYGFNNTTMGNGHLNAIGHKILADEIYAVLKEVE